MAKGRRMQTGSPAGEARTGSGDGGGAAKGAQDAGGADDVGLVGADGVVVGESDERLGGEMEDYLRGEGLHGGFERGGVADVAADVVDDAADAGGGEKVGVGGGRERVAAGAGSFGGQPEGEPAA